MAIKRIALLTSGGDAPGMNAAIRGVVRTAFAHKLEVYGVFRGYMGLINDDLKPLSHRSVSNIINRGGTILKTSRCPEFMTKDGQKRAVEILQRNAIDALVVIGGDGSYRGAQILSREWHIPCVGLPGTIDNDLNGTDRTIGSDTAVETALDAIDKIKDTVNSMERIFVVEVMGHHSGYIALKTALAGGAEQVLIPEVKFDIQDICHEITEGYIRGKASWIIVVPRGDQRGGSMARQIRRLRIWRHESSLWGTSRRRTRRQRTVSLATGLAPRPWNSLSRASAAWLLVSNAIRSTPWISRRR
jgi:6-phosphofructokinase 1